MVGPGFTGLYRKDRSIDARWVSDCIRGALTDDAEPALAAGEKIEVGDEVLRPVDADVLTLIPWAVRGERMTSKWLRILNAAMGAP